MAPKPRYSLQEVHQAIEKGRVKFTAPHRSVNIVVLVYEAVGNMKSEKEAEEFIIEGMRHLSERHFCKSIVQWSDPACLADVYGLIYDKLPWYVKFRLNEEGVLEEISFHPPERNLRTVGGLMIPKGQIKYEET